MRACLLLHGFTGGPYELEPLARHLRSRGWVCSVPTLPGHGGTPGMLGKARRGDWLDAASKLARLLSERYESIDLVGFSMGGLLAAYLTNRFPIRRLVLLNAAVIYVSPARFVRNAVRQIRTGNTEKLRAKHETPLGAIIQFMRLVNEVKPEFSRVQVPTLVVQGDSDEIVHPRSAFYIHQKLKGEKELLVLPKSPHMICYGEDAEELFGKVEQFLRKP